MWEGDTISAKLFKNLLQYIMLKKVNLDNPGIINGESLTHLRFTDDIVLIVDRFENATTMLRQLNSASHKVWPSYKYLGHEIRINRDNQTQELLTRIGLTWVAFGNLRHMFKSDIAICLKRKVFNQCVLLVLTYGAKTLTKNIPRKSKCKGQCWE